MVDLKLLAAEIERRNKGNVLSELFDVQREFVLDTYNFKVARCGRRAGKSYACAVYLLHICTSRTNANCCYLGLTRYSAKAAVWKHLKDLMRKYKVQADAKEGALEIEFKNGSQIKLLGVNNENTSETLRGSYWDLVVLDEAASFRSHLESVIQENVTPALMDRNGTLVVIGSPKPDFTSYFYQIDHDELWHKFNWTYKENPHIVKPEDFIERTLKVNRWTKDNLIFRREWLGQWVKSEDAQVYSYNPSRNSCEASAVPKGLHYVIGADVGWTDDKAVVVIAFNPQVTDKSYIVYKFSQSNMLISDFGQLIKNLTDKYTPVATVIDPGGGGKDISEEINARFGLATTSAKKTAKNDYIELINSDLTNGLLLNVVESTQDPYEVQVQGLQWADKTKRVEGQQPNHLCFVAGMKVSTSITESVNIEDLKIGDRVLTSSGYGIITNTLNYLAPVYHLTLSNKCYIVCTGNHPLYVQGEHKWIQAKDALGKRLSHLNNRHKGFKTLNIPFIKEQNTLLVGLNGCIVKFMNIISAQYQKVTISTTKTMIDLIMTFLIWSVLLLRSIERDILYQKQLIRKLSILQEKHPRFGMVQPKAANGTSITMRSSKTKCTKSSKSFVRCVENLMKANLTKTVAVQISALLKNVEGRALTILNSLARNAVKCLKEINTRSLNSVVTVVQLRIPTVEDTPQRVYNITVESDHNYYINSILSSNCDSTLYAWRECYGYFYKAPEVKRTPTSDEIGKAMERLVIEEMLAKQSEAEEDWLLG